MEKESDYASVGCGFIQISGLCFCCISLDDYGSRTLDDT